MEDLKRHEEMEMLVLEQMRRAKVLDPLIFGGGSMLRLCFELPRYSVDLDFYLRRPEEASGSWRRRLTESVALMGGGIKDRHEKRKTLLWEFRLPDYPHKLKIEVRKEATEAEESELAIAHSRFSPSQVRLRVVTLRQMWKNKVRALLERGEIRDAYDLEFLSLRNAGKFDGLDGGTVEGLTRRLDSFTDVDFKSTLGAILEQEEKKRVWEGRFSYLRAQLAAVANSIK